MDLEKIETYSRKRQAIKYASRRLEEDKEYGFLGNLGSAMSVGGGILADGAKHIGGRALQATGRGAIALGRATGRGAVALGRATGNGIVNVGGAVLRAPGAIVRGTVNGIKSTPSFVANQARRYAVNRGVNLAIKGGAGVVGGVLGVDQQSAQALVGGLADATGARRDLKIEANKFVSSNMTSNGGPGVFNSIRDRILGSSGTVITSTKS